MARYPCISYEKGTPVFLMSEVPLFLKSEVPLFLMSEVPLYGRWIARRASSPPSGSSATPPRLSLDRTFEIRDLGFRVEAATLAHSLHVVLMFVVYCHLLLIIHCFWFFVRCLLFSVHS